MREIEIRDAGSIDDYESCVAVQREVWGLPELEVTPVIELLTVHRYGGVCIGAFGAEGMVGFVYGMPAWQEGRFFHHSHMLAVLPTHRGRGIGERLKWAQRERVLRQGIDGINWTFDPLQAPNAHLNIERLGVVIREYCENVYGESTSPLHGGIPTDRFEADWWIDTPRVKQRLSGHVPERKGWQELPRVNRTVSGEKGLCCEAPDFNREEAELLVEIPSDFTSLLARDRNLALDWRLKTRRIFEAYLRRGHAVAGFHRSDRGTFYRLER